MRRAMIVGLAVVLFAGPGLAGNQSSGYGAKGLDELTRQKGLFKTTLINTDAQFSVYSKLCPQRVLLQFRGPRPAQNNVTTGSIVRKKSHTVSIPEGEDLATLRQIITDAFVSELGSCQLLELVEESGPETLVVRATVTDIVTDIASKSGKPNQNPKPYSVQGNIAFDLIDAETGAILARVGERRKSRKAGDAAAAPDAGPEWVNIWSWADEAAADLRLELDRILNGDQG